MLMKKPFCQYVILAGQALENAELTVATVEEVAQREKLNREVEIDREVQEGLFPQKVAGYPRPRLLRRLPSCLGRRQ